MEKERNICLVRPTLQLKEQALEYREEHFKNGETVINGSELFDQIENYEEWLAEVNRNTKPETVNENWVVTDTFFAVRQSDIVDCVTLASEPFIKGEWLKKGSLVMNMADYEVDNECIKRSSKVVVDYWENVKHRMISTVALMWKDGLFKDEELYAEIGEIVNKTKSGRENDDEIIYFNAVGAGIMDIAVATRCYKNAQKQNKGTKLAFWE